MKWLALQAACSVVAQDVFLTSKNEPPITPKPHGPVCTDCPNIIFSLTDDQDIELGGWDPMSQTKERFQRSGTILTEWRVHTPVCSPSRSEVVSGRYYHNIKSKLAVPPATVQYACTNHIDGTKYTNESFGEYLREQRGYRVAVFGKANFNIPGNAGFDRWFQGVSLSYGDTFEDDESPPTYKYKAGADEYATALFGNKSVEWLRRPSVTGNESDGRPFFLQFSPHCPHMPATPAKWYENACEGVVANRSIPSFDYAGPAQNTTGAFHELISSQPPFEPAELSYIDRLARLRCQCLLSVDDAHAAIDDEIHRLGLQDKTYWFITSDHGFALGNHRLPHEKFVMYDHALRIPMVVKGPGVAPGAQLPLLGTNVDYAPTWLGLAGIDTPATMDGRSLVSALVSDPSKALPATRRHLLAESALGRPSVAERTEQFVQHYCGGPWSPDDGMHACRMVDDWSNTYIGLHVKDPTLGSGRYKYGEFQYVCDSEQMDTKQCFNDVNFYELFDLANDPHELHNIYATAPDAIKEELARRLRIYYPCQGTACP